MAGGLPGITVEIGDALAWPSDVLVLKYAQKPYGLDRDIIEKLEQSWPQIWTYLPRPSECMIVPSHNIAAVNNFLFIGVKPLSQFRYREIRQFGREALEFLAAKAPETKRITLTIHGPGAGLDEVEAFESEIAGLLDAIMAGRVPDHLETITVVERSSRRATRLSGVLAQLLPDAAEFKSGSGSENAAARAAEARLRSVGSQSENKPHIFVAMPSADEMDDIYHYGIQNAVNASGFLCERADLSSFTGDVMIWVKERIATSSLVIAELTGANPNVYLEVGYAWGCGRPTVLLTRDPSELKFDTKGQRCLVYKRIKNLEASLHSELKNLRSSILKT